MCRIAIYQNPDCKCKWLQIIQQCSPNAGFSQCDKFRRGRVTYNPDEFEGLQCPVHDLYGCYDRNFVRMVVRQTGRLRVGLGPRRSDPGFDLCCSVM